MELNIHTWIRFGVGIFLGRYNIKLIYGCVMIIRFVNLNQFSLSRFYTYILDHAKKKTIKLKTIYLPLIC